MAMENLDPQVQLLLCTPCPKARERKGLEAQRGAGGAGAGERYMALEATEAAAVARRMPEAIGVIPLVQVGLVAVREDVGVLHYLQV